MWLATGRVCHKADVCACVCALQVPFSYKGTVLFSRTLSPHQVVTVHANGIASTLYKTENADVFRHLDHVCGTGGKHTTLHTHAREKPCGFCTHTHTHPRARAVCLRASL